MKAHFVTLESLTITSENELEAQVLEEFIYGHSLMITESSQTFAPLTCVLTLKRCDEKRKNIFREIVKERRKQEKRWDGSHDDTNSLYDWSRKIAIRTIFHLRPESARQVLIETAALAIAAIVSIDRKATHAKREGTEK